MKKNGIDLATLVNYVDDEETATNSARLIAEKCRDYYDGHQLDAAKMSALKKRNQPPVVYNMIQQKVDFLLGYEAQGRTDPKAFPRTPEHEDVAHAATDAIRFICDKEDFDRRASDCIESMIIEGTGGVSVEVEERAGQVEVVLKRLFHSRLGIDPYSMEPDASDARYIFYVSWKDLDEAKRKWPKAARKLTAGMGNAGRNGAHDDKPTRWYSPTRQRVMCVDICFKHKGEWHHAIFAKDAWLEEPAPAAYVDEYGIPQCKFIVASAKVDRDGQRYGPIKNYLDMQDEVNARRSKALHLLHVRQTFSRKGALDDTNEFRRQASRPDGHLEFPGTGAWGKDFGIIPNDGMGAQQFSMYQDAMQRLDSSGANAALQGNTEKALSGKAVRSLQAGGMLEIAPLFDIHRNWKRRVYRAIWHRVRQYWDEERWIRVTDDEDTLQFVGLNVEATVAEKAIAEQFGLTVPVVRQEFAADLERMYMLEPSLRETVVQNDVAQLEVDIVLEEAPDVVNVQQEQFEMLVELYRADPKGAAQAGLTMDKIIQASSLRNKDKLSQGEMSPEQQQAMAAQQQMQQAGFMAEMADKEASVELKRSQVAKNLTDAQQKAIETQLLTRFPGPDSVHSVI